VNPLCTADLAFEGAVQKYQPIDLKKETGLARRLL
jgi:hypothetical protein